MALKDWKKTREVSGSIYYDNKKKHLSLLISTWFSYLGGKKGYDVVVNYYNPKIKSFKRIFIDGMDRKSFDTKTQAIKFAKQYMRSH